MAKSKKANSSNSKKDATKKSVSNASPLHLQSEDTVRHDTVKSTGKHHEGLNANAKRKSDS